MSFKEEFLALCEKHSVVFDVTDRKDVTFYAVNYGAGMSNLRETVTLKFNDEAEYCEFVVDKIA